MRGVESGSGPIGSTWEGYTYWGNAGLSASYATPHWVLQTSHEIDLSIPLIQTRTLRIGGYTVKTWQSRGSGLFCLNSEHKCNKTRTFLRIAPSSRGHGGSCLKRPRVSAVEAEARRGKEPGPGLAPWCRVGKLSKDGHTENHRPPLAS